tara:strand:+ start:146 stop:289 length:144 start_codon:yes stop_codon:yes gene_type:complete
MHLPLSTALAKLYDKGDLRVRKLRPLAKQIRAAAANLQLTGREIEVF